MRSIAIGLICCMSAMTAWAQTRTDVTMTVDSVAREFIVVVPSGSPPAEGYPMVLMLHGTSGDGEKFYNVSGWKELGERENFVTVFPSSLRYCFYTDSIGGPTNNTTKWKNGEAVEALCPDQWMKDDVRFLKKMIDTIASTLPIDRSRVYGAGFSNGGGMSSKLAVEMSDVFAAMAASAGPLSDLDSNLAVRSLPFWFSVGTLDDRFVEAFSRFGWSELPFNDTSLVVFMNSMLRRYLGAFSLTEDYEKDSTALALTYTFSTPSSSIQTYEFRFTLLKGLYHNYPNGSNYPLSAPEASWQFFKQYSLPGTTGVKPLPERVDIGFFPNPAREYITVTGEGECTLNIYSVLGQLVYHAPAVRGTRIALPRLMRGVYRLVLGTQNGFAVSKVLAIE